MMLLSIRIMSMRPLLLVSNLGYLLIWVSSAVIAQPTAYDPVENRWWRADILHRIRWRT